MFHIDTIPEAERLQYRKDQRAALAGMLDVFDDFSLTGPLLDEPPFTDRYDMLAGAMFDHFDARTDDSMTRGGGAMHGLAVVGKLLAYAPPAYLEYCGEIGAQPDVTELRTALERSTALPRVFADMHRNTNRHYETWFGLKACGPALGRIPFEMVQTDDGPQYTYVRGAELEEAMRESRVDVREPRPLDNTRYRSCAAMGPFLDATWRTGVRVASEHPDLFAADLATLASSSL